MQLYGTRLRRALWLAECCLKINVLDFRGSLARVRHNLLENEFVFIAHGREHRVRFADTEVHFILGDVPTEEKVSAILEGIVERNDGQKIELSCIGVPRTFPFAVRESEWEDVNGRPWALYPDEEELACSLQLDKQNGKQTGEGDNKMKHVATALLFDRNGHLLIYLRDDNPTIPFPNHWDLFGGHIEPGESPEEALAREIREELATELAEYRHIADFECIEGDIAPNVKHVFVARTSSTAAELVLREGQCLQAIELKERHKYKFANVLGRLIDELAGNLEVQRFTENLSAATEE